MKIVCAQTVHVLGENKHNKQKCISKVSNQNYLKTVTTHLHNEFIMKPGLDFIYNIL